VNGDEGVTILAVFYAERRDPMTEACLSTSLGLNSNDSSQTAKLKFQRQYHHEDIGNKQTNKQTNNYIKIL